MSFEIFTDSAGNMPYKLVKKYGLKVFAMEYFVGENKYPTYVDTPDDTWQKEFYRFCRQKEKITTSCLNASTIREEFVKVLDEGKDLIYLVFSSGLSRTYDIAVGVSEELKPEYPDRKIYIVDTLAASFGQGLLVDYACRQRQLGKTIDEVYNWQEENKLKLCHWFTVDDLFFLKRGGRISASTAVAGTVLGIKPVMHVDNDGHLINVEKARGRKQSLIELVNHMEKTATDPKHQRVFIAHGDCIEDCKFVEKLVRDRFGTTDIEINFINPIIGTHSGPGTLALFFMGSER